jgi:hypothetical protein
LGDGFQAGTKGLGGEELVDDADQPAEIDPAGHLDHRDPTE